MILLNHILFTIPYNFWIQGSRTTKGPVFSHPAFVLFLVGVSSLHFCTVLYFSFNPFLQSVSPIYKDYFEFCSCAPIASLSLSPRQCPQSW